MKTAKKSAGRSANDLRPVTREVRPAPHDLMRALSRDLLGGERFAFVLNRAEARALADLPEYQVLKHGVTSYNLGNSPESDARNLRAVVTAAGIGFLNPHHYLMREVSRAAAERGAAGRTTALLGPVGTGTLWFDEYVCGRADVYFLRPRIPFQGFRAGHRSDFFAAVYPPMARVCGLHLYDWKTGEWRPMNRPSTVQGALT